LFYRYTLINAVRSITLLSAAGFFSGVPFDTHAQERIENQFRPNTFKTVDDPEFNFRNYASHAAADVDGDGWLDLVYSRGFSPCPTDPRCSLLTHELYWLRNNKSKLPFGKEIDPANNRFEIVGEFMQVTAFDGYAGIFPRFALGDIDADDDLDMISNDGRNDRLSLFRNSGNEPAFGSAEEFLGDSIPVRALELADVESDGDLDVLLANQGRLYVLYNQGSATQFGPISAPVLFAEFSSTFRTEPRLIVADIDGDDDLDVFLNGRDVNLLALNDGSQMPFSASTQVLPVAQSNSGSATQLVDVRLFDGDNDGDLDVFAVREVSRGVDGTLVSLTNNGPPAYFGNNNAGDAIGPSMKSCSVTSADLNNDNRQDLLVDPCDSGPPQFILLNRGGSVPFGDEIVSVATPLTGNFSASELVSGDFDNDGDVDLITNTNTYSLSLDVILNNGFRGTPMPVITATYPARVSETDGSFDVVLTLDSPQSQAVTVQFGSVPGTASPGEDYFGVFEIVEFLPGETEYSVRITLLDDDIAEEPETLIGRLAFAQGANIAEQLLTIIIDDDNVDDNPVLSLRNGFASERDGVLELTIEMDRPVNVPVSVAAATQERTGETFATRGVDFYGKYEVLTIPAGQTRAVFRIQVLTDNLSEDQEKVLVRLFNPQNASIATGWALGIIRD